MITIEQERRIWLSALLFLAMTLVLATGAFGRPYFLIDSEQQWGEALGQLKVIPMTESEWNDPQNGYMKQWNDPSNEREGPPYPPNRFSPPELYVYGGGGGGGYPEDAGLVMVWQPQLPGDYSSAWKYNYGTDPNLNNCTINITVTAPQFDMFGNQMNVVSFGIQDAAGFIRAWYWNCGGANPIPWNTPTTISINTALIGVAAATPVASAYVNNPGFNLANSLFFIVDENAQWVGGPTPVPPPGFMLPGIWNYWHNLIVTQNIAAKCNTPTKWSQPVVEVVPSTTPPTFNGWDEKSLYYQQPICADDWKCIDERPVTDIHWWGSFVGWDQPFPAQLPQQFHIGFWDDVPDPDGPGPLFSHPGKLIHEIWCSNYVWNFAGFDRDPRGLYQNEACFQFNQWLQPSEYFYQRPNPATGYNIYWLSIAAVYPTTPQYPWGWKTRPHFYNDDAVRITQVNDPTGLPGWPPTLNWTWAAGQPIEYPADTSWDLAFELTTQDPLPKWRQQPDLTTTGIDVKATRDLILADDFQCTKQTKVTDITVWGSWLDDLLPQNDPGQVTFTLSIHDDIPDPDGPGPDYSKPGNMLWSGNFGPGQFTVSQHAMNLTEGWWDPSIPTSYDPSGDTVCWMYDFDILPADAFCQQGSTANPKVYWLDVQATPIGSTTAQFGWKTSSSPHWNDDAVWGMGNEPYFGSWSELHYPPGHPMSPQSIDLAFEIDGNQPCDVVTEIDWGDAPDTAAAPGYPTLAANAGANHVIVPGMMLGSLIDAEADGQPNATATGDDINGLDDEDGVVFTSPLCVDAAATVDVTASIAGKLEAWIDFNGDGDWADSGEQIFTGQALAAGINSLSFTVPASAVVGPTFSRFRYSSTGGLPYTGPASDGEVEDYQIDITSCGKWLQPPDLTTMGIDVKATKLLILADDFQCTQQTKVTDITVWGSWLGDLLPQNAAGVGDAGQVSFTLSLHSDIPAGPQGYSQPGNALWTRTFAPGQFTVSQYATGPEGWWDPSVVGSYLPVGDNVCWRYDFNIPAAEAFCQQGSAANPVVYWLDVQAAVQGTASACILPDNGAGTADLPPVGCEYRTPDDDMNIIDGLLTGDTIEIDATHGNFVCSGDGGVCSFTPGCRQPGGTLGGEKECFDSQLLMPMVGTGSLAGFSRSISLPVQFEVHTAPRTLGAPVQSFDTDMFRLFGQVNIGDPDFDLLRVVAGTDFGLPSPGHTTLTRQPSGNWAVDSFFDITYRIDFVGAPGGPLAGRSGSTTGTVRFQIPSGAAETAQFGWKTSSQHWNDDAVWGTGIEPNPGSGTVTLPPPCPYDDVDGGMRIIAGLEPDTIEINTELGEYSGASEVPGGSLGGNMQTYNAVMPLDMRGTGSLNGFNRLIPLTVQVETHSRPRMPGDPVQSFDTDMFRLQGQWPAGDPDFDLLRITAGTGFGMPSPGHTTLTQQPGGNWSVDSFFDITYRIDFVGAPGGPLAGHSGSTTATFRVQTVACTAPGPWSELIYPPGHPMNPQSIDLAFEIDGDQPCDLLDFGDAPDPTYPTLLASDGARHGPSGIFMGALIDYEPDGQPNAAATGDDINTTDDEDGVVFNTAMSQGNLTTVTVTSSVGGTFLSAWVDFNGDGSWATPGDQIFVAAPMAAGPNVLTFLTPAGATANIATYARFRLHTNPAGEAYTGYLPYGEVEDYRVKIYKKVNKGKAKLLSVGSYVLIEKNVVTANFGSVGWYFEEPDRGPNAPGERGRSAGLGVLPVPGAASPWAVGRVVSCYGETVLNGCELMLQEESSWLESDQLAVATMAQNNRDSGGGLFGNQPGMTNMVGITPDPDIPAFGLNSVASLVILLGRCTCVEEIGGVQTNFWIDDGSNLWDGNTCGGPAPASGVKVRLPAGYTGPSISTQSYYAVTGIMRTDSASGGECVRWLWPRNDSDIVVFTMP
ncbi:MAG: GEVED domain-containing protein [Armatimonadota bacterium]|nr:GEVED domain-containing protein [Armatimonadota bacterium]